MNATQPQNVPDVEELTQAPAPGKAISGSTIQQTNKQTNKETNKQTNKQTNQIKSNQIKQTNKQTNKIT